MGRGPFRHPYHTLPAGNVEPSSGRIAPRDRIGDSADRNVLQSPTQEFVLCTAREEALAEGIYNKLVLTMTAHGRVMLNMTAVNGMDAMDRSASTGST
eukprot:1054983-Prymnesium_polylepis.1